MTDAVVLDASALIALVLREPGYELVAAVLPGALISAVNLAEVTAKLIDLGLSPDRAARLPLEVRPQVVPFDLEQATMAGQLRKATRPLGLSLGDRCCLALARTMNVSALTADRAWRALPDEVGVDVVLIRP